MDKRWRLIFSWPTLTLLEIDGDGSAMIPCDNALLMLLSNLNNGDTLTYEVNA